MSEPGNDSSDAMAPDELSGTRPDAPTEAAATTEGPPETVDVPTPAARPLLQLRFSAVSDVGRVRKDNQDSGYAGPWLLAVCDGVGGAARGDIASSTAIGELRQLDEPPGSADVIDRVNDGIHEAHNAIGAQVDHDPALNGTSTTATVALFDGNRLAVGHVGDSRAYLLRDGELSQLTNDHTFVQSLIDEGRITEAEARVHPHRNLILKALDGLHEVEPDLFALELVAGDRLFLCSDGACGVLEDDRITELLSDGSPEFAAIELVRASLDAGSSDNVTCVVADVVDPAATAAESPADLPAPLEPMVVGAAADLGRRRPRALFRGHRSGDTGELEPVAAEIPEGIDHAIPADPPLDAETLRYAPQPPPRFVWARRLLAAAVVLGLAWIAVGTAYWWSQQQYYIGEDDGHVVIYRGVNVPGLSNVYQVSDLQIEQLRDSTQEQIRDGDMTFDSFEGARDEVTRIGANARQSDPATDPTDTTDATDPTETTTSPTTTAPGSDSEAPAAPSTQGGAADLTSVTPGGGS
ncbi:PP2C family protein-serine/threonine phosphatase [Pimelobacter simplex]|uniref:Protein serine/threonine phosphatase PrpC, regulation of stationary phase n=1 Tax=Nocardioides simplex TaxID=2045 RepID=A0A0C5X9S1_NOCSI|nr:protein phosphatase 2C domain-containing protein [Pimelobacter simplex]AJR17970.1 Protein serine/threonine phosphatase PrpC, regulation of stationary phase [Pimelobacter simplex]GEB15167.1 protein phosphatase [Pimelobacter simplex]SFM85566.1 protein phosphatase [Pimelobacter simplex]